MEQFFASINFLYQTQGDKNVQESIKPYQKSNVCHIQG
jgi:hypothetical protein